VGIIFVTAVTVVAIIAVSLERLKMEVYGRGNVNVIMTFNPFKSTSSSKSSPHHQHHVPDNDSWHSQPQPAPSSGPLSWFSSGWTPATTLAAPASPAKSMIMLRASHSEGDMNTTNNSTITSKDNYLPSYPEPRMHHQQQKQMTSQSYETNEKLLEDFPPKANRTLLEEFPSKQNQNKATDSRNNTAAERKRAKPCAGEQEEAYPGFALYETARAQYCLRKYSEALDTTTECLAFQKLALGSSRASTPSPKLGPQPITTTAHTTRTNDANSNNGMTALDLRSTFVTEVGKSMRGVVQSMKTSSTTNSDAGAAQKQQSQSSPHPMLSNSMATMIAQYPLHPCIAQTLLLRGRVLADCALYGDDNCDGDTDFSLLLQAIRNIEISVAILRKIDREYDLATSLVLLGTLRTLLGHFDEADRAYEEALSIFVGLRLAAKYDQSHATDEETTAMCDQSMKRINDGTANVFYLRGKLYQSRRMHEEAFGCYRKALILSKCNGRQDRCVRRVVQCMKNRSALEKLVSAYIDDRCGV
jgi:tetratricopeptide (TPR) repeat protein